MAFTVTVLGVAISAVAAKKSLHTATPQVGLVEMRTTKPIAAGTFLYEGDDLVTGWHSHDLHQLEYALTGIAHVETDRARYLVPAQQAVWIPAGLSHCTTLRGRSIAVFFDRALVDHGDGHAHVLAATPVLREMMTYAVRWPIGRCESDPLADRFFEALALLVTVFIDQEMPVSLPTSRDPIVQAAMAYTQTHLADAEPAKVAQAAGISERTLRRRFLSETEMTWQQYLHRSRLLHAMMRLGQPGDSVTKIATEVGFDSVSAFSRAFRSLTGESPRDFRRRRSQGVR